AIFIVFAGISLCAPALLPPTATTMTNILALCGKCATTGAFMIIYQQAAELYPTCARNVGMGFGSTLACVVAIGIPYVTYLVHLADIVVIVELLIFCFSCRVGMAFGFRWLLWA